MKAFIYASIFVLAMGVLVMSAAIAGKGYMGGNSDVVVQEAPTDTGGSGGIPDTVEGPLNDKMADSGKLFGDLYRILRQQGTLGDKKLVPVIVDGTPVLEYGVYNFTYLIDGVTYTYDPGIQLFVFAENTAAAPDSVVGGEPVLTVIDPLAPNNFSDYGWYAAEIGVNPDETPIYGAAQSPYPAMCVQPVADYARWGDISSKTQLTKNRLPLVITYDATWNRSECAVGQLSGPVTADPVTGALTIPINEWFIEPGGAWNDPVNGQVTYTDGVLWTDLVGEVGFGRLNISRSPEAVLQSAFDEAVNNLNSPDTIAIEIDAAGRLLLIKNVYDPLKVDPATGLPLLIGTVKKAIDSPLENVALYVKLMQDGHLVTPGDEREPIDRSKYGGIPLWKMLELEDGPADAALRPTIDIDKLRAWGLGSLVDVAAYDYWTYYVCLNDAGAEVRCLVWNPDPVQPELAGEWVSNPAVVERILLTSTESSCTVEVIDTTCTPQGTEDCVKSVPCEGPFYGITTDGAYAPDAVDLNFTAGFLAAAADKTGHIGVDMVVYLNSILGINKVLGTSEDGTVDYEKNPVYFNYRNVAGYGRTATFEARGQVVTTGGNGIPSTYDGNVTVLQGTSPTWTETLVPILGAAMDGATIFDNIGLGADAFPNGEQAADNILGFTQQADDDLSVIRFIHTFQIPSLR